MDSCLDFQWCLYHHGVVYVQVPACQALQTVLKANMSLFICTGTVTRYTSLAIRQTHVWFCTRKNGDSFVPKNLQEKVQKKEAAGRFRQVGSRKRQSIRSASLKITDLRKCHLLFQNETSPLAITLRYRVNSIKTKWRCHLETQRTYFTLTIKILQSCCFVSELDLSKLTYQAEFFQFCRKCVLLQKTNNWILLLLLLPVIILIF